MTRLCSSPYFLTNIVHPKYKGKHLTDDVYGTGMDLAVNQYATVVPDLINYKAEASPFQSFMFQQNVLENVVIGLVEISSRPLEPRDS